MNLLDPLHWGAGTDTCNALDLLEEKPKYQGLNWSGSHPTETLYNALKFQEKGSNLLAVLLIVWR